MAWSESLPIRCTQHPRRFAVEEVVGALAQFAEGSDHEFWPDTLTLRNAEIFATERIHGSRHLTDLYLLAMAARHGGRLVTFDQGIPLSAVKTATVGYLCVL
jgi:predicted nucleic acid-binding protein